MAIQSITSEQYIAMINGENITAQWPVYISPTFDQAHPQFRNRQKFSSIEKDVVYYILVEKGTVTVDCGRAVTDGSSVPSGGYETNCDEGNPDFATCMGWICGNGVIDPREECDPGIDGNVAKHYCNKTTCKRTYSKYTACIMCSTTALNECTSPCWTATYANRTKACIRPKIGGTDCREFLAHVPSVPSILRFFDGHMDKTTGLKVGHCPFTTEYFADDGETVSLGVPADGSTLSLPDDYSARDATKILATSPSGRWSLVLVSFNTKIPSMGSGIIGTIDNQTGRFTPISLVPDFGGTKYSGGIGDNRSVLIRMTYGSYGYGVHVVDPNGKVLPDTIACP